MKYRYIVAFELIGVITPSADLEASMLELQGNGTRGRLTADLDTLPHEVDEATVIGGLLLKGFPGQGSEGALEERLAREVEELRQRRRNEKGNAAFLMVEAQGDFADFNPQPQRELPGYVLAIDDAPKKEIRSMHETSVHGMLAAIAIVSGHLYGVKKVVDSVTFARDDGTPLFCYTLSASSNVYVPSPIAPDAWAQVPRLTKILSRHQSLVDVARLLTRSLAEDSDLLLSFLSVWSGLEIFVNKTFRDYENRVLGRLSVGTPPPVPQRVIERIRSVMSDKYRLSDKFSVISSELADSNVEADQLAFESIKLVRDKLLHGEDVPLAGLPIAETKRLLRKYLQLHLTSMGA
ncbi:hypothetical protein IB236_08805 [Acidovorax sp. ACV02]|uniref:hypothetical protein n=1 Tax=Acidovorax sp. ACV02 TaxID=2769310 RepID=UPI00177C6E4A|nr:hypothetical protein [Acidovorax sp. ACV02]MBD9405431.1 hypothetical protein [Acidovorax sp. ACV02]